MMKGKFIRRSLTEILGGLRQQEIRLRIIFPNPVDWEGANPITDTLRNLAATIIQLETSPRYVR